MPDPEAPVLLPWQASNWEHIQTARRDQRLPHALLLTGPQGVGKKRFARALAQSVLCQSPAASGKPCGHCRGCHLFTAETHPDLRVIAPEEPGKAIRIDTIRDFTDRVTLTAQAGGFKVVIIEPADALNQAAANSLLKTLEEPTAWTLIMLITSRPGTLPATIRSRCQQLNLRVPRRSESEPWLAERVGNGMDAALLLDLASGAPLKALQLADPELLALRVKLLGQFAAILEGKQDPVAVAAGWSKLDTAQLLNWYSGWLTDCVRLKADPDFSGLINPDQRGLLRSIGTGLGFTRLYRLLDGVYEVIKAQGSQLNNQMVLEGLLLALIDNGDSGRRG